MKYLCLFILLLLSIPFLAAQDNSGQADRVTLTTGEVYIGTIQIKTDELVIIKTNNGARYQFQTRQVKLIDKISINNTAKNSTTLSEDALFCAQIETAGSVMHASDAFGTAMCGELNFSIGHKKVFGKHIFVGLGSGYQLIHLFKNNSNVGLIPLYIRVLQQLGQTKTKPYIGFDTGYSFGSNDNFKGGMVFRISSGIVTAISYRSQLYAGITGGVQQIQTEKTFQNEFGNFTGFGTSTAWTLGIKAGLQF